MAILPCGLQGERERERERGCFASVAYLDKQDEVSFVCCFSHILGRFGIFGQSLGTQLQSIVDPILLRLSSPLCIRRHPVTVSEKEVRDTFICGLSRDGHARGRRKEAK